MKSSIWWRDDDGEYWDIFIDVVPTGDFHGDMWRLQYTHDKASQTFFEDDWEFCPADGYFEAVSYDTVIPPEVLAEAARRHPDVLAKFMEYRLSEGVV